jgi:hypothetical protein
MWFNSPARRRSVRGRLVLAVAASLIGTAHAQVAPALIQQGFKIAVNSSSSTQLGASVAISGDGSTFAAGGPFENGGAGATYVFIRSGGTWIPQGGALVGSGGAPGSLQGLSVALSNDGNTLLVGGAIDPPKGAVWVFTRSAGVWSQQGAKLTGSTSATRFGETLALSADGNTAIVGSGNQSTAWIFSRSGGAWTEQTVATGGIGFGRGVALSDDGNTALVGADRDDTYEGHPSLAGDGDGVVLTRSGTAWSQQAILHGTSTASAHQGASVALSSDGNTAALGASLDGGSVGAVLIFTRSGSVWAQQGAKLVGTGHSGGANEGAAVALSGSGNTLIVGGPGDSGNVGAVWLFTRTGAVWSQQGGKVVGSDGIGAPSQGSAVAISRDGTTVIVGAPSENTFFSDLALSVKARVAFAAPRIGSGSSVGAVWVFTIAGALPPAPPTVPTLSMLGLVLLALALLACAARLFRPAPSATR